MTPDLLGFVRVLSAAGVDYIIVGGVAADSTNCGPGRTASSSKGISVSSCLCPRCLPSNEPPGRGKDREAVAELEALLEERDRPQDPTSS